VVSSLAFSKYASVHTHIEFIYRSMTRDEEVYPDAESFKPERFIKDGALNENIKDPPDIVFGFGRRWVLFGFHGYHPSRLILPFLCYTSECVLAATWLSALTGRQSLQSWPRLRSVDLMILLPEDGRYFLPGVAISCVSLISFRLCL
jgi:hypothetical protein